MRAFLLTAALLALAGCATDAGTESTLGELDQQQTGWTVVASDGDRMLVRGPASQPLPQTDERPTYEMEVRLAASTIRAPGRVLAGALVQGGAVWVRPDGTLIRDDGSLIDAHALPELSVSADGARLAYPRPAVDGGGVRVVEIATGARRIVSTGLALADRPLFLPDGRLVVIGARASGIAGVWLVDPDGVGQPLAITNGALRVGRPFGPTFVPPPAYHASMHVENGDLVYDDGRGEQRVTLPRAQ